MQEMEMESDVEIQSDIESEIELDTEVEPVKKSLFAPPTNQELQESKEALLFKNNLFKLQVIYKVIKY
jgi:hypothetical protein